MVDEIKKKVEKASQTGAVKESKDKEKKMETEGKEEKKTKKKEVVKKDKAIARGISLRISTKNSMAVCKMIKGKTPELAAEMLEGVVKGKRPVKMTSREVPHQKGKGIAGARYPKNAAIEIQKVVKQLNANSLVAGIENPVIVIAKADLAARPYRREGRRAKRTHIYLEAKDKKKLGGEK